MFDQYIEAPPKGYDYADDVFECIVLNENVWALIQTSLKFVPYGQIDTMQALVRMTSWRILGDRASSQPMIT